MLRAQVQALRLVVTNLKKASAESETQVKELEQQLNSVKTQTADLRNSFDDYRKRAEQQAAREARRKKAWRTASVIEFVLIVAGVVFAAVR